MNTKNQRKSALFHSLLYTFNVNKITAIILAAGKGTRFKSERPKVLHEFNGKPMIHHVIESVLDAQIKSICLVVGYKKDDVKEACKSFSTTYAFQEEQLGTGHAVVCGLNELAETASHCIVLAGDCPLIKSKTIETIINLHINSKAKSTLLTAKLPDAGNYGRIIRNSNNDIIAIREAIF